MKNLLFILVCMFTFQGFGQQGMKTKNQGSNQEINSEQGLAVAPTRKDVSKAICPVEGYTIILSRDKSTGSGVSEQRYIDVIGNRKQFYATAAQIQVLANYSGLPGANQPPVVYDGANGYLSVENVTIDPLKKYCGESGHRLIPANDKIYKVYKGSNHSSWTGSVTITSGSNLDSADTWLLVKTYNDKRNFVGQERVPQTCLSDCYNGEGGGGVDPDGPIGTTSWVDASGEVHDWFDDDGEVDGGIGNPSGGIGNVLYEKLSLVTGAVFRPSGDDGSNSGYVNESYGGHLGAYFPIASKNPVSYGVYASGDYLASNKDGFRHQPDGFEVAGMPSSVSTNSENTIKQSLLMFGVGPQINFSIGRKVSLSAIVQGGLTSFKQSGFSFIQEFQEGDSKIPVKIFNQEEIKSTSFFWIARLRMTYAITSKIGIWAEGNYMMSNVKANQTQLNPGAPLRDDGTYSFGQVNGGEQVERTNENSLKGAGVGVGITFSLSK